MPSIYLSLRSEPNKRGEHEIRLTTVIRRKPVYLKTGYFVSKADWDSNRLEVKRSNPSAMAINGALMAKVSALQDRIAYLDGQGLEITPELLRNGDSSTFLSIAQRYGQEFREKGKIGTADAYDSRAKRINELFPGIKAVDMTPIWAKRLEEKIADKAHNTQVGLKKFINSVLNKAERDGLIPKNNFARSVKGSYTTPERPRLSVKDIEAMWLGSPADDNELKAKLTFLFSYYAAGARFKDVLLMPKTALYLEGKELRMKWVPSKTERSGWIDIKVNPRLKKIIKLAENSSPSIFGLVHLGMEPRLTDMCIGRVQAAINKALKSYAARCGVKFPLAFHDARRAIAFHLKVKESDIYAIKDVLGHTSVNITQGYVGRNQKGVDDALKRVYG